MTAATLPTRSVAATTSRIPIVFAALGDAVSTGLIKNLSRPGGNLTGLSFLNEEISSKRLELLRDLFPRIQRIAVFDDPNTVRTFFEATQAAAAGLGVQLQNCCKYQKQMILNLPFKVRLAVKRKQLTC